MAPLKVVSVATLCLAAALLLQVSVAQLSQFCGFGIVFMTIGVDEFFPALGLGKVWKDESQFSMVPCSILFLASCKHCTPLQTLGIWVAERCVSFG